MFSICNQIDLNKCSGFNTSQAQSIAFEGISQQIVLTRPLKDFTVFCVVIGPLIMLVDLMLY